MNDMIKKRHRKLADGTQKITIQCAHCGTQSERLLYKSSRKTGHTGKFCNKDCMIAFMKAKSFFVQCIICGNRRYTQPTQIKYRNARFCSRKCHSVGRARQAQALRDSGVKTKHQIDRGLRYSKQAEDWRKEVFKRDDYTCQMCGVRGSYLEADHIKPFAFFPTLRFELSNGRTLCRPCHDTTKISYKRMRELYA